MVDEGGVFETIEVIYKGTNNRRCSQRKPIGM